MTAPSSEQPLIEVRSLSKVYGLVPALRGLDLSVARGEFLALLGHNGSGKSTLLRLLCGLSKPTGGAITIGGWSLPKEAAAVRAQIGLVGHKALLYDNLTARENLAFFAWLYDVRDVNARIRDLLDKVGLTRRADDLVRGYSRGMQQRLSIARALLHDPAVILLDEPHTGLDRGAAETLDKMLSEARAAGKTILMSTHEIERAAATADRAVILARGRLAADLALAGVDGGSLAATYAEVSGV